MHEGTCEANGVLVRYLRTGGPKPPVVLLHGLTGSGACWSPMARVLASEYDVVMPDARGHGGSGAPETGFGYHDLAADVIDLLRSLGLERPVLVGHSMGGMTAAVVASLIGGELRGLVLVDPTFIDPEWQREVWESNVVEEHRDALERSVEELVARARARHPRRSEEIIGHQARARLDTALAAFEVLAPPNPDHRDLVRSLGLPCLLVIGDSTIVSGELASELGELNPRLEVDRVPGAGHGLPFDQPERLASAVAGFLRRID